MSDEKKSKSGRSIGDLWRLLLFIVGIVAVVQELQKPKDQRTWHGLVGGFVPYDFRKPTMDRFVETYWNPEGPIISPKFLGVGWALNAGAVKARITSGSA